MNVSILGTGAVGANLGSLLLAHGYGVTFGSRDPQAALSRIPQGAASASAEDAARAGEVVIVATPWAGDTGRATLDLLAGIGPALDGKILVDATNPLNADWSPLVLGTETSAGEEVARAVPGAHVVKAFNTVFADVMQPEGLSFDGRRLTLFLCGDDAGAKETVADLVARIGFDPLDTGALRNSRYLEAMAHLNIQIAVTMGGGTDAAFAYMRR